MYERCWARPVVSSLSLTKSLADVPKPTSLISSISSGTPNSEAVVSMSNEDSVVQADQPGSLNGDTRETTLDFFST
ncbi:hypothetical protein NDU88_000602 [Pleurodeles waltl]|uniref:Uncharacterized protein n=1 Tax=Pleurodeles waltl TaxID=8319 RepID=A0AAV7Q195_PLEWA|nr:hypothetical protein NDU88_000602 [Pleurodeles waltl]